ncbi:MAG TPA: hypothetical protein VIA18_17635 [Polyangia bacterium]|nr:hypothetical protein [Polyangia bacterium]
MRDIGQTRIRPPNFAQQRNKRAPAECSRLHDACLHRRGPHGVSRPGFATVRDVDQRGCNLVVEAVIALNSFGDGDYSKTFVKENPTKILYDLLEGHPKPEDEGRRRAARPNFGELEALRGA